MRKAMLLLFVMVMVGSLYAADAFVGTWILDSAQSKLSPLRGPLVKESVLVIGEKGTDRESYSKDTRMDGKSVLTKWTVPRQGGMVNCKEGCTPGTTWVVTRISGGEDYWTALRDGKQVEVGRWTVSKDGKTIRGEISGVNAEGKPYQELHVGRRQ